MSRAVVYWSLCLGFLLFAPLNTESARGRTRGWPQQDCAPCSCREGRSSVLRYRRIKIANCSSKGLTSIPGHLPYDVEEFLLDGNDIGDENYKAFWNYNATKALLINNNRLDSPPHDLFRNATKLQYLDLTGNSLSSIPGKIFQPTSLLVDIHGLEVEMVPGNLFNGLNKLRKLELTQHQGTLPVGLIASSHLHTIHLTLHKATSIAKTLFYGGNSTLREIHLNGQEILSLPECLLHGSAILQTVKLILPKATTLPENLFQSVTVIEEGADYHLRNIHLEGIDVIPENLFKKMVTLEILGLHQIQEIPPSALQQLNRLNVLSFSFNKLDAVIPAWFQDLGAGLKTLDLSHNMISNIGSMDLEKLKSLEKLDLSHNHINTIHGNALDSFRSSVVNLDLSDNQICQLPSDMFHSMWALQVLKLNRNCLTMPAAELFMGIETMQELYLQDNNLRIIPEDFFSGLIDLEYLNISSNNIDEMPIDSLRELTSLTVLDISNNFIGPLPPDFLPHKPLLKEIYLGGNPLHCDCGVVYFTVLSKLKITSTLIGVCASPEQFIGQSLADLDIKKVCPDTELLQMLSTANPTLNEILELSVDERTVPQSTEPGSTIPESTVPGSIESESTVPNYTISADVDNDLKDKKSSPGMTSKEKPKITFGNIITAFLDVLSGKRGAQSGAGNTADSQQYEKPIAGKMEQEQKGMMTPLFLTLFGVALVATVGIVVYKIQSWRSYSGSYTVNRV